MTILEKVVEISLLLGAFCGVISVLWCSIHEESYDADKHLSKFLGFIVMASIPVAILAQIAAIIQK